MLGRIDYFFIYLLILVMAFYVALPVQAGVECLKDAIGNGKTHCAIYAVTVSVTLFALTALLKFFTYRISDVVSNQAFWVFPVFCIAIPILSLLLRRNREKE